MPTDANVETFSSLTSNGAVVVDFWGPRCQPCLALMPTVEMLEEQHEGRVKVIKVNAVEARQICRDRKVLGLPTFLLLRDGDEVARLSGDDVSVEDLRRLFATADPGTETMEMGRSIINEGGQR